MSERFGAVINFSCRQQCYFNRKLMSFSRIFFNLSHQRLHTASAKLIALMAVLFFAQTVSAETPEQKIIKKLESSSADLEISSVEATPWPGMYEVTLASGAILFSDVNAEYLVVGEMLNLTADNRIVNLSEQKFQKQVASTLASVPSAQQIIYPAKDEKTSITVFTDISCFYCKKLHKAIPELQEQGVTVKYMAFPRAGAESDIAHQMSSIWCAEDSAKAMDVAKKSGRIEQNTCNSPVAAQFHLGNRVGVNATPTIFTQEGEKIAGFASTNNLLNALGLK